MRKKFFIIAGLLIVALALVFGIRAVQKRNGHAPGTAQQETLPPAPLNKEATPADRQVSAAEKYIMAAPQLPKGYNMLAAAYMQKTRETGDYGYLARAEAALKQSLEVAPDNQGAVRFRAYILLS